MKIAALTMVYNEPVFLPLWRRYYGREVGNDNLFIIDHGSTDGSTDDARIVNKIVLPRTSLDEDQRAAWVSNIQSDLLHSYDAVVFSDVDEFVVPDPKHYSGLIGFVQNMRGPFANCIGLDPLHIPDTEGEIDIGLPILAQRRYVRFSSWACKPLVSTIPLRWSPGFHRCDRFPSVDRNLFLFHLKRMDYSIAIDRHEAQRTIELSERALAKGHASHFRYDFDRFTRMGFPVSESMIKRMSIKDFDFISQLPQSLIPFAIYRHFLNGKISSIPNRFHSCL